MCMDFAILEIIIHLLIHKTNFFQCSFLCLALSYHSKQVGTSNILFEFEGQQAFVG